jgi:hypothetical protein
MAASADELIELLDDFVRRGPLGQKTSAVVVPIFGRFFVSIIVAEERTRITKNQSVVGYYFCQEQLERLHVAQPFAKKVNDQHAITMIAQFRRQAVGP